MVSTPRAGSHRAYCMILYRILCSTAVRGGQRAAQRTRRGNRGWGCGRAREESTYSHMPNAQIKFTLWCAHHMAQRPVDVAWVHTLKWPGEQRHVAARQSRPLGPAPCPHAQDAKPVHTRRRSVSWGRFSAPAHGPRTRRASRLDRVDVMVQVRRLLRNARAQHGPPPRVRLQCHVPVCKTRNVCIVGGGRRRL